MKLSPSILGSGVGGNAVRFAAAQENLSVRAVARNPLKYTELFGNMKNVTLVQGDVTSRESVERCIEGSKACIFAVQAMEGVSSWTVDRDALVVVAESCAKFKCKLVVISSFFVSPKHRWNPIRGLLNIAKWSMMDAKWEGEELIRKVDGLEFVILRPGWLYDVKPESVNPMVRFKVGPGNDAWHFAFGKISKWDLGRIAVRAAIDETCTGKTFEVVESNRKQDPMLDHVFDKM